MTFTDAVRAHTAFLWTSRSAPFLLLVSVVPWVFLEVMFQLDHILFRGEYLFGGSSTMLAACFGAMMGLLAWRDEPPRDRTYQWTLPVDTSANDGARMVAGALWLMVAIALYYVVGMILLAAHDIPLRLGQVGLLPVLGVFLAALIGFGLAGSLAVLVNRPVEYLFGGYLLMIVLVSVSVMYRMEIVQRLLNAALSPDSRFGLFHAIGSPGSLASARYHDMTRTIGNIEIGSWSLAVIVWLMAGLAFFALGTWYNRGRAR